MQKLSGDILNAISMTAQIAAHYRKELLANGFTKNEAMELTKSFVDAQVRLQQNKEDPKKPVGLIDFKQ